MSLHDDVLKALDDGFAESVKGLYAAAWAKVTGGEPIDEAIKQFDAGLFLDMVTVHRRVVADAHNALTQAGES
jgi:hypothetical protein